MYEHAGLYPCMYVLNYSVEITRTICVLYVCIQMYMCTHMSENVCVRVRACVCVQSPSQVLSKHVPNVVLRIS